MPISNVDLSHTIDFARQVVNQISANLNSFLGTGGLSVTGNVIIAPPLGSQQSLNIANGYAVGNGFNLFSISASAIVLSKFRNSQLHNSSITITPVLGMNGGGTLSLGGSISMNIVPADSISNNYPNVAVSANAVAWANTILASTALDANLVNVGILSVAAGGTGRTSYSVNGQTFVGTSEGSLTTNTIRPGIGISAQYGAGGMSLSSNLVQGTNTTVVGNQITIAAPPSASESSFGIARLMDNTTCTSVSMAASSNSVNAVYKEALTKFTSATNDLSGRLIEYRIFSTPGTFTWTKPANTAFIELTMIGAGGGGAGAGNGAGPLGTANANYCTGGFAGAYLHARLANSNCNAICTITVGYGGNSSGSFRTGRVGYRGTNTVFSMGTGNAGQDYYANGGNGGLTAVDSVYGSNVMSWFKFPNSSSVQLATARGPVSTEAQPEYIITITGSPPDPVLRLNKGNVIGSFGGSVPGFQDGGWVSYCINTATTGGSTPTCYGPDGQSASAASNGSGFGGAGGGGAFNETASPGSGTTYIPGASGANGVVILKVYS